MEEEYYKLSSQILFNLKVLGQVKTGIKLYVHEDVICIDLATQIQSFKRRWWNWYYGGADRTQMLIFLQRFSDNLTNISLAWMEDVKTNAANCNFYLGSLKEIKLILPSSITGLKHLQITYSPDPPTEDRLKIITTEFCFLLQKITEALADDHVITLSKWIHES